MTKEKSGAKPGRGGQEGKKTYEFENGIRYAQEDTAGKVKVRLEETY